MFRFAAAAALALSVSACVSRPQDRVPDTADTPKIRKALAIAFVNSLGHNWLLGTLPLRAPSIAGPYQKSGSTQQHFCIGAIWPQGPFRRTIEASAFVEQRGNEVSVTLRKTDGFYCQGGAQPFTALAELVAEKTGVPIETVLAPPPPPAF